ncbi:MAG: 3-deoxy-7-phosphoheptulonate synthase [Opitutaceae bacterium]
MKSKYAGKKPVTQDLRIRSARPLLAPGELQEQLPITPELAALVSQARKNIAAIIGRRDDRLLVVVGPCSIHDPAAALEYARLLRDFARRHTRDLAIVMRVYFEKPRTVMGWKGLINDPGLDGSFRINDGLRLARKLLLDAGAAGLPAANEFLDATIGQYFADLVSWGCIGARTVESQVHRQLASGLSMPVGFKNRTDGDTQVAIEAMQAAAHPHWFTSLARDGRPAVLETRGNRDTHLVLRGGSKSGPNFSSNHIAQTARFLRAARRKPAIMVDCSHANSGRDPARQALVAADLAAQIAAGERALVGVMLESNLVEGRQDAGQGKSLVFGQSVTDACIGWTDTTEVLRVLASAVRARRKRATTR